MRRGSACAWSPSRRGRTVTPDVWGGAALVVSGELAVLTAQTSRMPLATVLAVAAVHVGASGVAREVLGLRVLAPVLAWLAWLVLAADGLGGLPVWHTAPLGLAMIVVVEIWRTSRHEHGRALAALEVAGIAILALPSVVSAFTEALWHALVVVGIGVLVLAWSVLTKLRRRLVAAAVLVLVGLVTAALLPLVALVPAWGGAGLWVGVTGVGLLVVGVATFLERGRSSVLARVRSATKDWR